MATSASEILGRIENDAVFAGFLEAGFDPAQFASKIVRADVGKASAASGSGAVGAAPVLLLQEGGDGIGSGSGGGGVGVVTSAESVSSQAEITLDSMSSHIARIESAIQQHILDKEEDFLGSVGGVTELSRRTDEFRDGVRELRRSFARVQREVSEPHEAIRLRTQQLKNLHAATRLLKRALRFLAALRRLRAQEGALGLDTAAAAGAGGAAGTAGRGAAAAGGSAAADLGELAKAAQSLQELECTLRDSEVSELEVVGRERAYVEACGAAVRRMAADALARGMKGLNQTDVGGALQVFFNLECLPARVKACVTHLAGEAEEAVSNALQPAALADATSSSASLGAAGGAAATSAEGAGGSEQQRPLSPPPPGGAGGGSAGRRAPSAPAAVARRRAARMRAHAGKVAAALHGTSMEAWGLQRVLDKKRDPTSRALLDATVRADRGGGGGGLSLSAGAYRAYWDGLCRAIRGAVERALEGEGVGEGGGAAGGGVALVSMYPFLRKAFLRLLRRLEEGTSARSSHRSAVVTERGDVVGGGAAAAGRPGILGGSRWLSMALDAEFDDDLSLDAAYGGHKGGVGGGAEAGAGPVSSNGRMATSHSGRRLFGRRGGKGDGGGVAGGSGGGVGSDSSSDGARLLEALGPLRDIFLARSLERLTMPVEQMFPQFDGYTAAVPSKHDLASFVRSIHAELALAVPAGSSAHRQGASATGTEAEAAGGGGGSGGSAEADLTLLPLLLKGVVQAARLFCAKTEAMRSVEEGAYKFGGNSGSSGGQGRTTGAGGMMNDDAAMMGGHDMPGMSSSSSAAVAAAAPMEAWSPTSEQEHNLQLLELVVKLRDALLGIPALVIPPPASPSPSPYPTASAVRPPGSSSGSYGGSAAAAVAAAGGDGLASPAAAAAAAASGAEAEAAVFGRECRERVDEAVRALDETATRVFLEPYLSGVARALESIVAKMHRENFGPGASSSTATMSSGDRRGGGGGSLFLLELQGALAALQADHFGRISALRTPCAEAALRSLAGRVLRAYVTHCALIRPLSEEGKAKVAQDMATLEIALSPLARVSELGAVYQESRAFRTLLFVDDAEEDDHMDEGAGAGAAGRGRGRDSRSFLTEACMAHLRPTSVWHYLFSRAPDELSSPHVSRGISEQAYVSWLLGGGAAEEGKAREEKGAEAAAGGGDASDTYAERSFLSPDTSYMAEVGAWGVVQACLDEYHQRRSATNTVAVGANTKQGEVLPRAATLLPEAGPALLSAYESRA